MKIEKYNVSGMTCSACSSRVEKCVGNLDGINNVSVNLLTNSMVVEFDEEKLDTLKIISTVEDAGYGAELLGNGNNLKLQENTHNAKDIHADEIKEMKNRLIWSFTFLIPMMYISMAHMIHHMLKIPVPQFMNNIFYGNENAIIFSFAQFLLLIPIMYLNQKYYKVGFKNLFHKSPNMDSLIAIGSSAAAIYGVFAIFAIGYGLGHNNLQIVNKYTGDLYFESAGMIVTLITLGKFLESKSKGKTSKAIEKLMDLAPKKATIERDGKEIIILSEELKEGDIVVVRPGESIAADGTIVYGNTSIDESAITGESIPVEKKIGDKVVSATINKNGFIKFKADKVGDNTTISAIIRLVEEASSSKAPIAKMADKISGIFVPVVISIAVITSIIWLISGASFEFALSVGISVLVISCPCALGLATPVAIMVGSGKGAQNGILIKSGEALETAHNIDIVVMDKTGTITEGKPKVTNIKTFEISQDELLKIAGGMENKSEHPLAEAIMEYIKEKNINYYDMHSFDAIFGRGITAEYENSKYYAGNIALMNENGINSHKIQKIIDDFGDEGKTPLVFAKNNEVVGIIAVADVEKETSKKAIELFKKMNINVVMLTGDNKRTAEAIRKRMGISQVIAEVMPQEKEKHIAALQEKGHKVAMIGDGINDAPALAKADLGMAIGAGTDVAIESADVVLMRNDLLDAVSSVKLSKAVIRNIKENLFWAFFYNVIGIPLAAGALYPMFGIKLSPMFGAAAMSMSSVCVVLNALRLRFFKPEHNTNKDLEIELKEKDVEDTNMNYELVIEGMMCGHCQKRVEDTLMKMDGVDEAKVNLEEKKAYVKTTKEISIDEFDKVINDAGYELIK